MLLQIKQRALTPAVYEIIHYKKNYRERFGFVEGEHKTYACEANLLGHKYRFSYSDELCVGFIFEDKQTVATIDPVGQELMKAAYPFVKGNPPRKHQIIWRGYEYHIWEEPKVNDGLYYPITDTEGEIKAVIERGTTIRSGLDNYMLTVERDGDVAMAIMAALYIDTITSLAGKEAKECEIVLPQSDENTINGVDKDYIARVTRTAISHT